MLLIIKEEETQVTHTPLKSIRTTLGKKGDSVTTYVIVNLSPEARRRRSRTKKLISKSLGEADVM